MAVINVKITDLPSQTLLDKNDLFLVSHPIVNSDGTIESTPYTSNSMSAAALSSNIFRNVKDALQTTNLSVSGNWTFHTNVDNIPKNDYRYAIDDFLDALEDDGKLTSIINDGSGWYHDLPTSFLQDPDKRSGTSQSLSVSNNSVANIDMVERIVAGTYNKIMNYIKSSNIPSHVGQIIHSTTLSNLTAVREAYGTDTNWIQHTGYYLKGANSGIKAGSGNNKKDGGEEQNSYAIPVPAHTHNLGANAGGTSNASLNGSVSTVTGISYTRIAVETPSKPIYVVDSITTKTGSKSISGTVSFKSSAKTNSTGSASASITVNHNAPYKNVYIWERIS